MSDGNTIRKPSIYLSFDEDFRVLPDEAPTEDYTPLLDLLEPPTEEAAPVQPMFELFDEPITEIDIDNGTTCDKSDTSCDKIVSYG